MSDPGQVGDAMTETGHWVLVLGTGLARILRDLPRAGPPARAELVLKAPQSHLRRVIAEGLLAHRGGPAGPGSGADRSVLAEDDGEFVRQVVALLEAHRRAGELARLSVIAVPRMLVLVRDTMTASLRALVDREVAAGHLVRDAADDLVEAVRRELWPGGGA